MDLAEALKDLGAVLDRPDSIPVLTEARSLLTELGALNPLTAEQRGWLASVETGLAEP